MAAGNANGDRVFEVDQNSTIIWQREVRKDYDADAEFTSSGRSNNAGLPTENLDGA